MQSGKKLCPTNILIKTQRISRKFKIFIVFFLSNFFSNFNFF